MKIRRVVTGHTPGGKSAVVSDSSVDPVTVALTPGTEFHTLWGGDAMPMFPDDGSPLPFSTYFPPPGGFRFGLVTVPPKSSTPPEILDLEAALKEMEEKLPGMASHMDPNAPGMHVTDTIDFIYVISGEIWLELDDGKEVLLRAGDTLVQNGTRHGWHNKGSEPCRFAICLNGTHHA